MTREDIIRMAREAGIRDCTCNGEFGCLERFAALVAAASEAKEREACAKVCEENADDGTEGEWDSACINCADHIRDRGQA